MENSKKYILRNIHAFSIDNYSFLVDADNLNVYEVDTETMEAIDDFKKGRYIDQDIINDLIEEKIVIEDEEYLKEKEDYISQLCKEEKKQNYINKMVLGVSNLCNMNCTYCYGGGGNYGLECALMKENIAKKSVDYLVQHSGIYKTLYICFFGGEPLCNIDLIKKVVEYCKEQSQIFNKNFKFSITTNGTLINDDILSFFKKNRFAVMLSLDGPEEIHNMYRRLNNGDKSYDIIKKNIIKLKENGISFSTRATLCATYTDIKNIYEHSYELGASNSYVSIVSVDKNNELYVTDDQKISMLDKYKEMADELYNNIIAGNWEYKSPLINFISRIYFKSRKVIPCGAGTSIIAVNFQGNIYPCQRFMGNDMYILDNVNNQSCLKYINNFTQYNVLKHPKCQNCWMKFLCSGNCHHSNLEKNGDIYSSSDEVCDLIGGIYEISIYTYWRLKKYSENILKRYFENI